MMTNKMLSNSVFTGVEPEIEGIFTRFGGSVDRIFENAAAVGFQRRGEEADIESAALFLLMNQEMPKHPAFIKKLWHEKRAN